MFFSWEFTFSDGGSIVFVRRSRMTRDILYTVRDCVVWRRVSTVVVGRSGAADPRRGFAAPAKPWMEGRRGMVLGDPTSTHGGVLPQNNKSACFLMESCVFCGYFADFLFYKQDACPLFSSFFCYGDHVWTMLSRSRGLGALWCGNWFGLFFNVLKKNTVSRKERVSSRVRPRARPSCTT